MTASRPTLTPVLLGLLALLSSFTPLCIDMYLPALPVIAGDLGGTAAGIASSLMGVMQFGLGALCFLSNHLLVGLRDKADSLPRFGIGQHRVHKANRRL